jgi:carbamoyltransferase
MKKNCPAVVHVDSTARPQLIREEDNPSYYQIVKEYEKITGLSTVINTSFNMHEEPIVYTPDDALRSFSKGKLDALVIGRNLVLSESN